MSSEAVETAKARLRMLLEHLPVVAQNLASAGAELRIMTGHPEVDVTGGLITYATEENILKLETDRFSDHRDICVHECAHMLHTTGFGKEQCAAISARFKKVQTEGLWPGCYALTNESEFFAELTMWYFGTRGDYGQLKDPQEGPEWLKQYDPESYNLLDEIFSGRMAIEKIEWKVLSFLWAIPEKDLRSLSGDKRCQIMFHNKTAETLEFWWLDYEGRRVRFGEVGPGERASMDTYETHPWVLTRPDGRTAAHFIPDAGHCLAVIE